MLNNLTFPKVKIANLPTQEKQLMMHLILNLVKEKKLFTTKGLTNDQCISAIIGLFDKGILRVNYENGEYKTKMYDLIIGDYKEI